MKILCITHAAFESPGIIVDWAKSKGHQLTLCKSYQGESCLQALPFDCLIVMGGPQDACRYETYPYLEEEVQLIKNAVLHQKIILGFCLGAQLIGTALGARASRSPEKEIGVYPITLTDAGLHDYLLEGLGETFPAVHWHNDMPGETADSVVLASSAGCPRQIIRYAPTIYGFQCHLEITQEVFQQIAAACPLDFKPSRYTQSKEEFGAKDFKSVNQIMLQILDRIAALYR